NNTGGNTTSGIDIQAGSSTVRGLDIVGFHFGISIENGGGNTIAGNLIGLLPNSTAAANLIGVFIDESSNNVVGGTTVADRNVISGNSPQGVGILFASSNVVEGNYIGTDRTGSSALGSEEGVVITAGSTSNVVGGTTS